MQDTECIVFKSPTEVLDWQKQWGTWLGVGEAIATSVWVITGPDASLTESSSSNDPNDATIHLIGGTYGMWYRVTNRVTTDAVPARTAEASFIFIIDYR